MKRDATVSSLRCANFLLARLISRPARLNVGICYAWLRPSCTANNGEYKLVQLLYLIPPLVSWLANLRESRTREIRMQFGRRTEASAKARLLRPHLLLARYRRMVLAMDF